jgi:hypothetical protein
MLTVAELVQTHSRSLKRLCAKDVHPTHHCLVPDGRGAQAYDRDPFASITDGDMIELREFLPLNCPFDSDAFLTPRSPAHVPGSFIK